VAATGGPLYRRVARLLGQIPPAAPLSSLWPVAAIALLTVGAVSGTALTQRGNAALESRPATTEAAQEAATTTERAAPKITQEPRRQTATSPAPAGQTGQTYVGQIAAAGYTDLSVEDIVALKIHGITAEYIRGFQSAGFKPSVEELVAMHIHDITAE